MIPARAFRAIYLILIIAFATWLAVERAESWRPWNMNGLINRLKEPSSWAAIAAGLSVFGVALDPGLLTKITTAGTGVAALAAFFMRDPGSPDA